MRAFALLSLASVALAGTITKRDYQTVYNDVTGIDTAVKALTSQIAKYNGGIEQSKPVFDASIDIHAINRKGFADANASQNFTSAQSKAFVDHVNDSVGVSIPAGLTLLESKKPLFDAAQLSYLVDATISLLRYDHDTFSLAAGKLLTLDQAPAGLAAAGKIDAALAAAQTYYATPLTFGLGN